MATSAEARTALLLPPDPELDYVRHLYDRMIDWYKVAETKAQLVLTANGALVAIILGLLSSKISDLRQLGDLFGPETWILISAVVLALAGAVGSATSCLLSYHTRKIRHDFARLGVNSDDPDTYCPEVLWYFGHLGSLRFEPTVDLLQAANRTSEIRALTYSAVSLAGAVLRKHRLMNAGWILTAVVLLAFAGTTVSILIRSQL